jgi:5-hydroxyisourate hydrolase-like protein (transthyretin family)
VRQHVSSLFRINEPVDDLAANTKELRHLSGHVIDPNGRPVPQIEVALYRIDYRSGRETRFNLPTKTLTNDRGEYRLFWLRPGRYYVGAAPNVGGGIAAGRDAWALTYYPSGTNLSEATVVPIAAGSGEITGIDFKLQSNDGPRFKISGIAVNETPSLPRNPVTNVIDRSVQTFLLMPHEPSVLDYPYATIQNALPLADRPNGEFEIRNVPRGSYDLYAIYGRSTSSPLPIEVRDTDVTGLQMRIGATVSVTADVVIAEAGPSSINPESLRLGLGSRDPVISNYASGIEPTRFNAAGTAVMENIPQGTYLPNLLGLPQTAYVEAIRQGGSSVLDTGFVLSSQPERIQIVVNPAGFDVEGNVENPEGKPAANATVVLVLDPDSRRKNPLYKIARTNESGHFTLRGVPPGRYTIFTWAEVPDGAWQNARFLSRYQASGRPVTVPPTSPTAIRLRVIPSDSSR